MQKTKLVLILIIIIYLTTRLYKIGNYPIFTDESMYLNWGRLIWLNPFKYLFFSLTDGQQPFYIWLASIAWKLGGQYYLIAGRLISVFSGLGTIILLYSIGQKLFSKSLGLIAGYLYLISPFTFWYDRLAIKDSFLLLLACLIFYLSMQKLTFKRVLLLGITLGIALLTKSIAYFFILLTITTIFLFNSTLFNKYKKVNRLPITWAELITKCAFIVIIALGISQIMRFSDAFENIVKKNQSFLLTTQQFINSPFQLFENNLYQLREWLVGYISIPILLFALFGFICLAQKKLWQTISISLWAIIPLCFELLLAVIFFPRYILVIFLPVSIFAGYGLLNFYIYLKNRHFHFLFPFILLIISFFNIMLSYQLLNNPIKAQFTNIDRWQYIEGWPSGYGIRETVNYIDNKYQNRDGIISPCLIRINCLDENKSLNLITEDITLTPAMLALEYSYNSNVTINNGIPNKSDNFPYESIRHNVPNLFIISNRNLIPKNWPLELVSVYPRPNNKSSIRIYRLNDKYSY